jgi:EAL and modified HD-GYP domain-containing signal transduction protein
MPYAKFVKVDVRLTTPPRRSALVSELRSRGLRLIAQSVETPEQAAEARAAGYRLFQGRYFCAPVSVGSARIVGTRAAYLHLLGALNRSDLSVAELEDLIKHDASLCYRVLQSVNSAVFGLRREIWSIRQAIVLLGHDQIRKWASVWALSELNVIGVDEMLSLALVRARACELLGEEMIQEDERPGCFLLGLCSVLDVLTGRAMTQLLDELPLPRSIKDALLGRRGRLRSMLDAIIAYEQGDWDGAARAVDEAGPADVVSLPDIYASALTWVPGLRAST